MAVQTARRSLQPDPVEDGADRGGLGIVAERLGIDSPPGWWPATPRLKDYQAAGFALLQVQMAPFAVLADERLGRAHASALRDSLRLTGLRLILHASGYLHAGTNEHDRLLRAALRYAALAGSDLLVYHGAQVPIASVGVHARLADEARSLRRLAVRAGELGVRIAIENLAPSYPGPEQVSHDPAAIAELVSSVGSDQVGMCLDVGHAHVAAGIAECELVELIEPVLEHVILFHVHDNFGGRSGGPRAGGIEPLRLDLHLPPGAGSVPWLELAPLLMCHTAPIQLEIHPAKRPAPATLATVMRELLGLGQRAHIRASLRSPYPPAG